MLGQLLLLGITVGLYSWVLALIKVFANFLPQRACRRRTHASDAGSGRAPGIDLAPPPTTNTQPPEHSASTALPAPVLSTRRGDRVGQRSASPVLPHR